MQQSRIAWNIQLYAVCHNPAQTIQVPDCMRNFKVWPVLRLQENLPFAFCHSSSKGRLLDWKDEHGQVCTICQQTGILCIQIRKTHLQIAISFIPREPVICQQSTVKIHPCCVTPVSNRKDQFCLIFLKVSRERNSEFILSCCSPFSHRWLLCFL